MGDDSEWLKLPAEEKVQHKVRVARAVKIQATSTLGFKKVICRILALLGMKFSKDFFR